MEPQVLTIGHSNHTLETFLDLLQRNGVLEVIDVRSSPVSRHAPHFSQDRLRRALEETGMGYTHMKELGGRPREDRFYDSQGRVQYPLLAKNPAFKEALKRAIALNGERQAAFMCTEKDPLRCHRTLLVAHQLDREGTSVEHITGPGPRTGHNALMEQLTESWPQCLGTEPRRERIMEAVALQSARVGYSRKRGK